MTQSQSVPFVSNLAHEIAHAADPAAVTKLQQAANLANENCDRATAIAHTLSSRLRDAQSRINQLELEADGLVQGLRAETESAVAKFESDANARVERMRREAEARIAQVEADAERRVRHLQDELAQAQQLTEQAKADAQIAHDQIARAEIEANERLNRGWTEIEDRVIRLRADLAHAELRAKRAEQWLVLIHQEIEDNLMPALATMHEPALEADLGKPVPPALRTTKEWPSPSRS
jgi:ATP-dependent Clp protease ATP-binding subunit ClpA